MARVFCRPDLSIRDSGWLRRLPQPRADNSHESRLFGTVRRNAMRDERMSDHNIAGFGGEFDYPSMDSVYSRACAESSGPPQNIVGRDQFVEPRVTLIERLSCHGAFLTDGALSGDELSHEPVRAGHYQGTAPVVLHAVDVAEHDDAERRIQWIVIGGVCVPERWNRPATGPAGEGHEEFAPMPRSLPATGPEEIVDGRGCRSAANWHEDGIS